ncbi:MAG: alpha/beta fold hydrolase [Dehalococcoidia bacterium]
MPAVRVATGFDLFYRESGDGDPILWIMGLGNDHRGWALQVPAFRDRFRCITYDNRDSGQSQRADGPYTVADMAGDAVALLDALGIEQAHVVGFSMGGGQAQELAIRHPDRVNKLVLCSTYTSGDPRGEAIFRSRVLLHDRLTDEEYRRVTLPWAYTYEDYQRPGFIQDTIEAILNDPHPQDADAYRRQIDATLSVDTEARLDQIRAPTLLVFGEEDITTPLRFARALEAGIPHARLVLVPGAGHGLPWSHPDALNEAIRAFLDE